MASSAVDPFWGPQTSYLNFCEEDYVITRYIAEFINTLSSLIFVVFGIFGLVNLVNKNAALTRAIPYFGLMGVGICSAGYHMTLKYHTQMSDELSMHLLTTPLLYRLLTVNSSPQRTRLVGIILSALFTIVITVHMVMDEFLLHATAFGFAVWLLGNRSLRIIRLIPNPTFRTRLRNLVLFGLCNFIFGYFVWLIDVWACQTLTDVRNSVGLPLAFLFELHGWWHVFTAIGGLIAVAVVDQLTSSELNKDPVEVLAWPVSVIATYMPAGPEPKVIKAG